MELLLILSALLTGLTGAFSGDRVQGVPQLQAAGVEASASAAVDQLAEAAATIVRQPVAALPRPIDQAEPPRSSRQSFLPAVIGASERRLE